MDRQPADAALPDDATSADAEQAERLSRAARGVVHEPADPRLEKAFGHLGLFPETEPETPSPAPGKSMAAWQISGRRARRRADLDTWSSLNDSELILPAAPMPAR